MNSKYLNLTLIRAKLTRDVCTFTSMSPYALISINKINTIQSSVRTRGGKTPVWNEKFIFYLSSSDNSILYIDIYHKNEIIGSGKVSLFQVSSGFEQNLILMYKNNEVGLVYFRADITENNNSMGNNYNFSNNNLQSNMLLQYPYPPNTSYTDLPVDQNNIYNNYDPYFNKNLNQYENNQQSQKNSYFNEYARTFSNINKKSIPTLDEIDINNKSNNYIPENSFNPNNHSLNRGHSQVFSIFQHEKWYQNLTLHQNMVFFQHDSKNMYHFNFATEKWNPLPNLQNFFFAKYHRSTELPDFSYIITGGEIQGIVISEGAHYTKNNFKEISRMNYPRRSHSTIFTKGYVFVFGGYTNNGGILSKCEKYDIVSGTWTEISEMIYPRGYTSVCKFCDDVIFLSGGYSNVPRNNYFELDIIEKYSIVQDKFEELIYKLPFPVYGSFSCQVGDSKILIGGGFNNSFSSSDKICIMDLFEGTVVNYSRLSSPCWTTTAPYFVNGNLFIFYHGEEVNSMPRTEKFLLKLPI